MIAQPLRRALLLLTARAAGGKYRAGPAALLSLARELLLLAETFIIV